MILHHHNPLRRFSTQPHGFFSDLRLKIASTLTSSLSSTEKSKLFESMDIKVSSEEQKELENYRKENREKEGLIDASIGEAVASAVAKEASKRQELGEKQRTQIWEQAEKATRERIEMDLQIQERNLAMKRWEKELKDDKLAKEKESNAQSTQKTVSITKHTDVLHRDEIDHPILGPILADVGYKRLHIISAQKLSAIPIWEKQRVYRHDRAKSMASDKLKSSFGLPGVISLFESTEGKLSILDGQHRVGMLTMLDEKSKNGELSFDTNQILVEVFQQPSSEESSSGTHAKDIFTEINKAEPVKLVDMPGVAKAGDRRIINDAASGIREMYPEMFKPSQRCRPPHLNVDNFRDSIFASDIIKKHKIKGKKDLTQWIMAQNDALGKKFKKENPPGVSPTALSKAKTYDFYLGIDQGWLYK